MAKGYPDFFGFSTFPQRGHATREIVLNTEVLHGEDVDLLTISGKGVIYSGYIYALCEGAPHGMTYKIYVDSELFAQEDIGTLLDRGYGDGIDVPILLVQFNQVSHQFTIVIQSDISFVNSLRIEMRNNSGETATVSTEVQWARVT